MKKLGPIETRYVEVLSTENRRLSLLNFEMFLTRVKTMTWKHSFMSIHSYVVGFILTRT